MSLEQLTFLLIGLGFLPWHIRRRVLLHRKRRQIHWQILAIFWQLTFSPTSRGHSNLRFTIPLIQRLAAAIWSALHVLIEK